MLIDILAFIGGILLVVTALDSAVRTVLVPRALQAYLARTVFVTVRRLFGLRTGARHTYEHRDRVLAFYAPFALLTLLATWLTFVLAGYTFLFFALGVHPLREAFLLSGSSAFTLGSATHSGLPVAVLVFSEAAIGLMLLALLITYLPSLYSAFSRREVGVTKLEVRAGQPASGIVLIERAWLVGRFEDLKAFWQDWEDWFAEVDETHTTYGTLVYYRSPHGNQSWITAAGAVLDGAALLASCVAVPPTPEPQFTIRAGFLCLVHIAQFFHQPVNIDPAPTDPISVTREEFDAAFDQLEAAGVPMKADREQAWRDFAGWRVNYDQALISICRMTFAPPALWSSDRYPDEHYKPTYFPKRRERRREETEAQRR
ncbi:MAG: hypothetical protein ABI828_00045 [Actinomycetota bacterium]